MNHTSRLVLCLAWAVCMTACESVYYRARGDLPADADARIALRIEQADDAARTLVRRLRDVRRAIADEPPDVVWSDRVERADAAAWELDRRLASVGDVAAQLEDDGRRPDAVMDAYRAARARVEEALGALQRPIGADADEKISAAIGALERAIATSAGESSPDGG